MNQKNRISALSYTLPLILMLTLLVSCGPQQVRLNDTISPPLKFSAIKNIGLFLYPDNSPSDHLFQTTLKRNLASLGQVTVTAPHLGTFPENLQQDTPIFSHESHSNVLILIHVLSHFVTDELNQTGGRSCIQNHCEELHVPMGTRDDQISFRLVILQAFPYKVLLDKKITTHIYSHRFPLSLLSRSFEPQKTLDLKLYAKISQHIAYLIFPVKLRSVRPFYTFDRATRKSFLALSKHKTRLALFFLNSDYSQLLRKKKTPNYKLYDDFGVVYEAMGAYSLSDYFYRKALTTKNQKLINRFEAQVRSYLIYFIGVNIFEEGKNQ
ncbi:MAG: hypothetical protein ACYCSV_01870 [Leptospirillum sp.]